MHVYCKSLRILIGLKFSFTCPAGRRAGNSTCPARFGACPGVRAMDLLAPAHKAHRTDRCAENPTGYLTLLYRSIFFLHLCKRIKSMGLEIRKLLFIPLVIIQTRWYNTMPLRFCVYVLGSYVLRKSISSGWCDGAG